MLYKVYVLGDHVSVYKRRSLPNLPRNTHASGYLEFDSQRPYPRLSDFGFEDDEFTNRIRKETTRKVTAEEVKPIVEALKEAFGLELFGFDVLITSNNDSEDEQRMLVVDVNYFPSYKEVPHFPALLARYLTDHAIESRRHPAS
jgi:inositol-1,3,4-trisphosphate 5/6-kinase/inositol-tetrakisphosphate 1-kinase